MSARKIMAEISLSEKEAAPAAGAFRKIHEEFRNSLSSEDFKSFEDLKSNQDRISFAYKFEKAQFPVIELHSNSRKKLNVAEETKRTGNEIFRKNGFVQAAGIYTRCILLCPGEKSRNLAVYYANRSACYYHLDRYETALGDIEMASGKDYPQELMYKLLERKARCLLAQNKHEKAYAAFKATLNALDLAETLSADKKEKLRTDAEIMISLLSRNKTSNLNVKKEYKRKEISVYGGKNGKYKAISSTIGMAQTEKEGTFARAEQNIPAGQTILVERPFCSVLMQKCRFTHCHHCFKRLDAWYPCDDCDNAIFCCPACWENSRFYHEKECGILSTLWDAELSLSCFLSLRVVTKKDLNFFTNSEENGLKFDKNDYESILSLVTHENNRTPQDLLQRTHVAVFLLRCLEACNYFKGKGHDAERLVGGILLRNLQMMQFNSHEIFESRFEKGGNLTKTELIGAGLYSTLALFNHSCNPAVMRYFEGDIVVVKTIRPLKVGEVVSENYGPVYWEMDANERRDTLKKRYWFDCECEACRCNWPTIADMKTEMKFKCPCGYPVVADEESTIFVVKCGKCGKMTNILKALKTLQETDLKFKKGQELLRAGKWDEASRIFAQILDILDGILTSPFRDFRLCQEALTKCFLTMGNVIYSDI